MTSEPRWQQVLYGRTLRADKWWRVRPHDIDVAWLNALVLAGTGGGDGLADQPRFLSARRGPVVLVGGACRAARLHDTMNSDGSRPLYCFVGWLSRDAGAAVPSLRAVEEHFLSWAAEAYAAWMRLDWNRHPTDLTVAHEPPFDSPPWRAEAVEQPEQADLGHEPVAVRPPARGGPVVVPIEASAEVWRHLTAGHGDFAYVVGPRASSPDPNGVLTHLSMSDHVAEPAEQADVPESSTPQPDGAAPQSVATGPTQEPRHWDAPPHSSPPPGPRRTAHEQVRPGHEQVRPGHDQYVRPAASGRPEDEGFLQKGLRRLRQSWTGEPADPRECNDETTPGPSTPSGPASGPAKDLDYWQRRAAKGGPPKAPPTGRQDR